VIYHQFSVSYTAKIKDNMKTLAENRAGSVDLFLDERISQLTGLANTHSIEQLKDEEYLNKALFALNVGSHPVTTPMASINHDFGLHAFSLDSVSHQLHVLQSRRRRLSPGSGT
jgi:hypothetical protein